MTKVERILDQYDRAMDGDAWHGDPVWKILDGLSADQAAWRISPPIHTIWELVSHMMFWETEVCRRMSSLPARPLEKLNFPAMPKVTAENWAGTLAEFRRSNSDFRTALTKLDDRQLDQPMPGREKSVYVEVHGVIQHHVYHAGQIAILSKIMAASTVIPRL
jgi:uncharacterized damage-inducible protein DinB